MSLKPQDIMVALKLCSYQRKRPPMSIIAADLKMSPSEVHAAIKRLQQARLLHGPEMEDKPNLSALEEFLLHGVKYAFPAERGAVTRGLPTSFAAPPLIRRLSQAMSFLPCGPGGKVRRVGSPSNLYIRLLPRRPSVIRFSTTCSPWLTQSGMDERASGKQLPSKFGPDVDESTFR
jgi:DNA-binding Lrp family transcriptional regulator